MRAWLARRRLRKTAKQLCNEARRLRNMHEDIADPKLLAAVSEAEQQVKEAQKGGAPSAIEAALETLNTAMEVLSPPRPHARIRENVEIFVVAIVVAMGFRTYFIQPFKIPTGSMQPTLYGIYVDPQMGKQWYDHMPFKLIPLALFGESYQEVHARASGSVAERYEETEESIRLYIAGVPHEMPRRMTRYVQPGLTYVEKGQIIASGRVRKGDHIFVNKVRYNFQKPKRGDIFVFSTSGINYDRIRPDSFYIKRMAGMPGETLRLEPPYLVADGVRVTEPYPFHRLLTAREQGYFGYQLPYSDKTYRVALGYLDQELHLANDEYLPLGDNTRSSLDGRYFGAVNRRSIVGPAFMVYWPFGPRWGFVQ
ncbi:MAG: signal peptidase I [Kiritimatiellae bacterium]|nr:signal peptidase I [Kiritimatiellia bacterium]